MKSTQQDRAFFGHPWALKGLFFAELWERFSYYGIRPLLILYMTALITQNGMQLDRAEAAAIVGLFAGAVYFMTILGGWIADHWLGQIRSVYYGSLLMSLGHFSIALNAIFSDFFFYFGLLLIVLGTGLFKTCIAVIVGLLYKPSDDRRDAGFLIFYMGINIGSFFAPFITGLLSEQVSWHAGFAAGGIGMLLSMLIFRFYCIPQLHAFDAELIHAKGLNQPLVHKPYVAKCVYGFLLLLSIVILCLYQGWISIHPILLTSYITFTICIVVLLYFIYLLLFSSLNQHEKVKIILCVLLFIAAALFWSAYEQTYTVFNLFALEYTDRSFFNFTIPTVWFQSINPLFVIAFAPIMAWLWIFLSKRQFDLSHLSKFIFALILAAIGFVVLALACQNLMHHPDQLASPWWLISSFLLLTLGELCLSPIGLSAMTQLAPEQLRGQIMGLWCTTIAIGNLFAGLIGGEILSQSFSEMAGLLYRYAGVLLIGAVLLFILSFPMQKIMAKTTIQG